MEEGRAIRQNTIEHIGTKSRAKILCQTVEEGCRSGELHREVELERGYEGDD